MKVLAINGSPRKNGNTSCMIKNVFTELEAEGIETELYQMKSKKVRGCIACRKCFDNKDQKCGFKNDDLNEIMAKMIEADGIILGSPTYFSNMTPELKAVIDRSGMVAIANGRILRRKVGAAVVAARRAGSIHTFNSINHFFTIEEMIIPGSTYWNVGFGLNEGDVEKDEEATQIMKSLGKNMAWLLKKLNG
jgi:multimeric flavodoxin WrbA